ncbi:MAG TPA: polysaccharide deacetylase family protein [Symbiobacteriaceae bacterium]|nr:polysaccharide deacetylase family protein [Symbiobacteriaceae bacterium]
MPNGVVRNGPRNVPQVALTFDDGPDTQFTPQILEILERFDVPASFYVIGERAEQLPDALLRIVNLNGEVGNHAYEAGHVDLRTLPPAQVLRTLSRTHEVITRITGQAPVTFRPPFGFYNVQVLASASRFGYQTVLWDIDSLDWQSLSAQQILQNVLPGVQNGSIILMHSGTTLPGEDLTGTVQALPTIISDLRQRGFELVTVADMLGLR